MYNRFNIEYKNHTGTHDDGNKPSCETAIFKYLWNDKNSIDNDKLQIST